MEDEGASIDVADRVDQAHDATGAAQVEARQVLVAQRVQVEERVAGEGHRVIEEPVVELDLLLGQGVELVPGVGTAPGRTEAGEAQLGAIAVGEGLEAVELGDVVAGHHDRQLERPEVGVGEVVHRLEGSVERALTPHRVVGGGVGPVDRDLDVEVVHAGQAAGVGGVDTRAVGRELHADAVGGGVVAQVEEVRADHRLTTADVHVEHLEGPHLVDHAHRLGGGEFTRVAAA